MAEQHGQVVDEELNAEREARRRVALAQIRQFPDPALRMTANEVTEFDRDLAALAERMKGLMDDANGVGLAANQVGILRRVFVFLLSREDDERPIVAVNPRVTPAPGEPAADDEGCLSLQGVLVPVERPAAVVLEAQDLEGKPFRLELDALGARVVQHELDHLDGVPILDRTTREAHRGAMAVLRPQPILG